MNIIYIYIQNNYIFIIFTASISYTSFSKESFKEYVIDSIKFYSKSLADYLKGAI